MDQLLGDFNAGNGEKAGGAKARASYFASNPSSLKEDLSYYYSLYLKKTTFQNIRDEE